MEAESGFSAISSLTFFIDLPTKMLGDGFLQLPVIDELSEQFLVLVHPVDEHFGKRVVKLQCKVFSTVHLSRLT